MYSWFNPPVVLPPRPAWLRSTPELVGANSCPGLGRWMWPMGSSTRCWLKHKTHSRVASSTASRVSQGSHRWVVSASARHAHVRRCVLGHCDIALGRCHVKGCARREWIDGSHAMHRPSMRRQCAVKTGRRATPANTSCNRCGDGETTPSNELPVWAAPLNALWSVGCVATLIDAAVMVAWHSPHQHVAFAEFTLLGCTGRPVGCAGHGAGRLAVVPCRPRRRPRRLDRPRDPGRPLLARPPGCGGATQPAHEPAPPALNVGGLGLC